MAQADLSVVYGLKLGFQARFYCRGGEGMVDSRQVTGKEIRSFPVELADQPEVFPVQGRIGDGAAVRIDIQRNSGFVEAVYRVVGQVGVHIGLEVAGRANFEEDVLFAEVAGQGGIFYASDAVAYASGMKVVQRFPDAFRSGSFTGVGRTGNAVGVGVMECGDVFGYGIACFVGGDVEADDVFVPKFFNQFYCSHALCVVEMPECAEYYADPDAGFFYTLVYGAIDGGDDLFSGEALVEVLEGREAYLGIDDVVFFELVEYVQGDEAQGCLCLHEVHGMVCPGDVVGQVGAYRGSDELVLVFPRGDRRV